MTGVSQFRRNLLISVFAGAVLIQAIPMARKVASDAFSSGHQSFFNPDEKRQTARVDNVRLGAALNNPESPLFQQYKKSCERRKAPNMDVCVREEIQWSIDFNKDTIEMSDAMHKFWGAGLFFTGFLPMLLGASAGFVLGGVPLVLRNGKRHDCPSCNIR